MSNDYFRFKQFTVRQHRCAMKVGTDGTLLGAWARGGQRILDIGTGTGLIALMMAQRFPGAAITAVDIDTEAAAQAADNVSASPFGTVSVVCGDIRSAQLPEAAFDAIVTNPPFFADSLVSPDAQRTAARHDSSLSYRDLMAAVRRLMASDGELSVVVPFDCRQRLESEAVLAGLFLVRQCAVRTTPRKPPRRYLLAFRRHPAPAVETTEGVIESQPGQRSTWYEELTKDFYL